MSHHVCSEDELEPGERTLTSIGNITIGVFNIDGEYFALQNTCQHQHGPVCEGKLKQKITAEQGEIGERIERTLSDTPTISCPLHGWEYEVETGKHVGDPAIELPTYDVVVDDGEIFLEE